MNSYTDTSRVGVAGATGYTGVELLRLLARHPRRADRGRDGFAGRRAAARAGAATSVWDAPVDGLDIDALADDTDAVFLALPEHAAAEVAPALARARQAGLRSVRRVPAARRRAAATAGIRRRPNSRPSVVYGLTEREPAICCATRRWSPAPAAIRRPRFSRCSRSLQAGLIETAHHHRREVGRLGRRQDADRADAFQRVPRQHVGVRRVRSPPRRGDRAGARRAGDVRAAPRADRPRHPRDDLRAARSPACDEPAIASALQAAYADSPFVRLTGGDLPGDQARRAHELLRHRLARRTRRRGSSCWWSCIDNLVKGAAGQAVQNFNVAFGFDERLGLN